jgi:peptidoglycan/LPS O-acetylase OafA/YrhL
MSTVHNRPTLTVRVHSEANQMTNDASEDLPEPDPITQSSGDVLDDWKPPAKRWDLAGIATAIIVGALPVLAELYNRGTDKSPDGHLFNPSTIGYSFFAIGAAATVQCAQNAATRAWAIATLPSVVCGLILGLNYSDADNSPDGLGWTLVVTAGVLTGLAVFVGWRPGKNV